MDGSFSNLSHDQFEWIAVANNLCKREEIMELINAMKLCNIGFFLFKLSQDFLR